MAKPHLCWYSILELHFFQEMVKPDGVGGTFYNLLLHKEFCQTCLAHTAITKEEGLEGLRFTNMDPVQINLKSKTASVSQANIYTVFFL